jgi:hypothetical protein
MNQRRVLPILLAWAVATGFAVTTATQTRSDRPPRDTAGQKPAEAPTTGRIGGRVFAADNGRPVRRARVFVSAPQLPEGRATLTDDTGAFDLSDLPAGRYTLTVSKTGFINLSYGQRRPLQPGTPIQLAEGQQLTGIEFRLPPGGVIAGRILDDSGDPAPGVSVRVMQYRYAQGNRQLVPAGTGQTDDQGSYRIWGLNPGDYYVSAVARNFGGSGRGFAADLVQGRGGPPDRAQPTPEQLGYTPTFYPGVPSVDEARPLRLGVSGEVLDVSFSLMLVQTARVAGRVTNPDGSPTTAGSVNLLADTGSAGRGLGGGTLGARIQWDGSFSIVNVPPGRYVLRARSDDTDVPQYATQPLAVSSGDRGTLTIVLAPGGTISGTLTLQATQSAQVLDLTQLRVVAPAIDFLGVGQNPNGRVASDGTFTIEGVAAGPHWIRMQNPQRGWALKSVLVDAREVIDTPIDLRSGQKLPNVTLVLTDRLTEVNGTVSDERGTPITEHTILAFPLDSSLWRPQARQIMTARPDQNGKYLIRGLPPGEYYVTAIDPAEPGEWFEPAFLDQQRANAARLTLGEGDVKSQDFRLTLR